MDSCAAIQFLHDRHPHVINAVEGEVTPEMLHLELFWFGGHVGECIDDRAERSLRRSLETVHHMLVKGDRAVRLSVIDDFLQHIVFAPDIEWARMLMPPFLAEASRKLERHLRRIVEGGA